MRDHFLFSRTTGRTQRTILFKEMFLRDPSPLDWRYLILPPYRFIGLIRESAATKADGDWAREFFSEQFSPNQHAAKPQLTAGNYSD
jgi:hypothetical protein